MSLAALALAVLWSTGTATAGGQSPLEAQPKVVYLTFDDGPSPKWTPAVLRTLARHGARATFFVVGSELSARPELGRRIAAEGHLIGNHTYNHVDLTRVDEDHLYAELDRAHALIRRVSGQEPRLLRPPFGASNSYVRSLAARRGYRIALWDVDPQDWRRPGAAAIARTIVANVRPGSIVLLHDGGGDRSQTIAALDGVLRTLGARGYRFASLAPGAVRTLAASEPSVFRGEELVASFTSRYEPGQPRVTNIRRAAELLDGTVIRSGGRFSMNEALGRRTLARGFVPAPMISGGRLVQSVGGGISQVATALYNAAFFGGLTLVAHTPHSFYISRYPMGREATISWGGPELVFRNDWPAPVRMRISATGTAVTVRMYSEPAGRKVVAWTGRPYAYVRPTTRVVHNPGLPLGSRRVVQEAGGPGFTIEYGRRVLRGGTVVRSDRFRVRYEPVNRIIEVGTR